MKFTAAILALSCSIAQIAAVDTENTVAPNVWGVEGEDLAADSAANGGTYDESVVYDGTCLGQSHCLGFTVSEIERRCGSGSCEFYVCYQTEVGVTSATAYDDALWVSGSHTEAEDHARETCKQHPDLGVDYAGNMHTAATFDEGGCLNMDNPNGKGYWDSECINPETADASTGIDNHDGNRFSSFCQVAYPGETIHFMMHSVNRLDWDGENPEPVTCSGYAEIVDENNQEGKWGKSYCAPSNSSKAAPYGQTYFPATDGSSGGTCSSEPETSECVWSYTAPTDCAYEENSPTCYITQESVDTVTNLCGAGAGPVVEYFEHSSNPNSPPPRVPLHDIKHNGDGTVSFKMYNPYGNYDEPIDYTSDAHLFEGDDFHNMYVVYDQANEIGNEVCDLQTGAGKCASDIEYTAKCRSDGVSIVTIFAAGFDETSGAAQGITNEGVGTDVFQCCPETYQPLDHYNTAQTSAWTFLIHCDCPEEEADPDRRRLRGDDAENVSSKFHKGLLFSENQKKLHNIVL